MADVIAQEPPNVQIAAIIAVLRPPCRRTNVSQIGNLCPRSKIVFEHRSSQPYLDFCIGTKRDEEEHMNKHMKPLVDFMDDRMKALGIGRAELIR